MDTEIDESEEENGFVDTEEIDESEEENGFVDTEERVREAMARALIIMKVKILEMFEYLISVKKN